ncbi:hypothetical protein [Bradyrhizobium sp. CB2312]|uniref:hypothetical protein n=1 Tax=Bradyrhizobium sp. CB2312 TaxID=3039155 RepID=UPI0032C21199
MRQQTNVGAALVEFEPALLDRVLDARAELRSTSLERVEKRRINLLDVNAAVLDGLDAASDLYQLAGRTSPQIAVAGIEGVTECRREN